MKLTFLTLTMAAQLAAGVAMAQTSDATTTTTGAASASGTFGSDWSTSLGSAMFGEDGNTVRSDSEIATQWATLSEEDRNMIRRDCMVFMQGNDTASSTTDATAGTTGSATAGTDGSVTTGTDTTAGGATGTDTTAGSTTGTDTTATGTTGTDTTAGSTTGTDTTATGTTGTDTTATGTTGTTGSAMSDMIEVSSENMQAICAATTNL